MPVTVQITKKINKNKTKQKTGKFLKRWLLTCLLRNLYAGQEAAGRTEHGTTDWFQIGKGVRQGCLLSSCLFNLCAEYIVRDIQL